MAKKAADRTGLYVFAGLAAVAAVGITVWFQSDQKRAKAEAVAAASIVPILPKGHLQMLQAGMAEAHFLALDETRREGRTADVMILRIGRTATSIPDGGAMVSERLRIDCDSQRIFEGEVGAFDIDGKLVSATNGFSGKHGRPVEASDYEVAAVCSAAKGRIVADWRVAQRESQDPPEGFAKLAEARPKDGDGWAWLCAYAARGVWRSASFLDCSKAIALKPDDLALRVDRAYIDVKTGRWAEAEADFRKVLTADPKNAPAQYGLSLLRVLAKDEAGGRTLRGKALDLDPDVPKWAAQTYKMPISQEYRVR